MESIVQQLSTQTAALAREASRRLFHVPVSTGGRSALSFDGKRILVPAIEAAKGEELRILAPGGKVVLAKVIGFDQAEGFAVLELAEALPGTAWTADQGLPELGSLLLSVAFPSDEGPEARLDLVRIAHGEPSGEDAYIQTDGSPFPGFAGGALVSPTGALAGVIAADRSGNHGWALPAARARALVDAIVNRGFPGKAWLGVSTLPVDLPEALRPLVGGRA
ncbi:MAG: S1C family serine protease, partial [Spirochaetota bacterium]